MKSTETSKSILWTLFAPISEINDSNADSVINWLQDRSSMLVWFTSLVTGSLVLFTIFGKKPGIGSCGEWLLSFSVGSLFLAILCNLICVWQIPKWKLAIRMQLVRNGRAMTLDLELMSWMSLTFFLAGLLLAVAGAAVDF